MTDKDDSAPPAGKPTRTRPRLPAVIATPPDEGGNLAATARTIGYGARQDMMAYERFVRRIDRDTVKAQDAILSFGRHLQQGRDMSNELGRWIWGQFLSIIRLIRG